MRDEDLIHYYETHSNPTGVNSDSGEGCLFIIIFLVFIASSFLLGCFFGGKRLKTEKKIEPTIELTTDGKTVDTVYIYRKN